MSGSNASVGYLDDVAVEPLTVAGRSSNEVDHEMQYQVNFYTLNAP